MVCNQKALSGKAALFALANQVEPMTSKHHLPALHGYLDQQQSIRCLPTGHAGTVRNVDTSLPPPTVIGKQLKHPAWKIFPVEPFLHSTFYLPLMISDNSSQRAVASKTTQLILLYFFEKCDREFCVHISYDHAGAFVPQLSRETLKKGKAFIQSVQRFI